MNGDAVQLAESESTFLGVEAKPLTERVLSWLPGPRVLWLVVWLLVPWMNAAVTLMLQWAGYLPSWQNAGVQLLSRAAFSFAIFLSVWGAAKIAFDLRSLRPRLFDLVGEVGDPIVLFGGVGSGTAPLLLTVGTAIIFGAQGAVAHGDWVRGFATAATWLLIGIPLWSFISVYLSLQIGLNRLGRRRLSLKSYPGDRSLGLRPLGRLAFTAFWIFLGALTPLVLTTASNRLGLAMGLLVVLAGVATFFLSLRRLNRQMVATKQQEVDWARHLYAQAVEPVRAERTLEALQSRSALLAAAEALENRAQRIQEWPFDEATFARVMTIASTVVAAIVARLLVTPFGL